MGNEKDLIRLFSELMEGLQAPRSIDGGSILGTGCEAFDAVREHCQLFGWQSANEIDKGLREAILRTLSPEPPTCDGCGEADGEFKAGELRYCFQCMCEMTKPERKGLEECAKKLVEEITDRQSDNLLKFPSQEDLIEIAIPILRTLAPECHIKAAADKLCSHVNDNYRNLLWLNKRNIEREFADILRKLLREAPEPVGEVGDLVKQMKNIGTRLTNEAARALEDQQREIEGLREELDSYPDE